MYVGGREGGREGGEELFLSLVLSSLKERRRDMDGRRGEGGKIQA